MKVFVFCFNFCFVFYELGVVFLNLLVIDLSKLFSCEFILLEKLFKILEWIGFWVIFWLIVLFICLEIKCWSLFLVLDFWNWVFFLVVVYKGGSLFKV